VTPGDTYAGRVTDSLLDRVARLPFVAPAVSTGAPPRAPSDRGTAPAGPPRPDPSGPTGVPASVLLALAPVDGADDLELLLVQRPDHLRQHAGQVGLPGGAVEPGDADGVAAALREAQEEVGLDPAAVRVLGSLDRHYLPVSDFDVLPVVGLWDGRAPLRPSPAEVAGILRPTLRQLADPANHGTLPISRILGEAAVRARGIGDPGTPVFWVGETLVWGFTAGLLVGVLRALDLEAPPLPVHWGTRPPSRGP
jgi:8-oxo-dGTP pyrophosphatase MutT (NUDIX family)